MKTYKAIVSFGDGKPFESAIEAKTGATAHDKGFILHPGARSIQIVGVLKEEEPLPLIQVEHPLFSEPVLELPKPFLTTRVFSSISDSVRDDKISHAIKLRKKGLSYSRIAAEVDAGITTVRKWMFDAKVP
jgi:hypothetical protein